MSFNWELLDRPYFVRRVIFCWMIILLTVSVWWFFHFAQTSTRSGTEIAAIIAAVNVPLCYLISSVMAVWRDIQSLPAAAPTALPTTTT